MPASRARWWCDGGRPRAGAVRGREPGSSNRGRARSRQHQDVRRDRGGGGRAAAAAARQVLGVGLAKNSGVRRGMVRDIDETSRSIVAAMRDAERMAGVKVNMVTCGIAGEHVSARTSPGVVAVSGDEITAEDVARVNEVARAVSLGRDHELLHDIPQEYVVDQQRGISDPVGMTGTRLEVEMYLVTVQATAAQNLRRSVERARYRPAELV